MAALLVGAGPTQAAYLDVLTPEDSVVISACGGRAYAGANGNVQTRVGSGGWINRGRTQVNSRGCISEVVWPAELASSDVGQIAIRVLVPRQRTKKGTVSTWRTTETGYRVWPAPRSGRDPIPHLDAFAEKYQSSVATVLCYSSRGGGAQGTAFRVPVTLGAEALATGYGDVYLVTAGHVVAECNYSDHNEVTVVYRGQEYRGLVWNAFDDPDVATIVTSAPLAPVQMSRGARPQIGDAGVSIGTAGGIVSTTTQGTISGVSDVSLNTTIPSGHGASGGPVFNNRGQLVGIITAGNGSLTVVTAIPTFCTTVYAPAWCSTPVW